MTFPPGRAIFVLLLVAIATGVPVALRKPAARAGLIVWTFDPLGINHDAVREFETRTGTSVDIKTLSTRALDTRLLSIFMSDNASADTPDLVEIEIGSVGKFLRPAAQLTGFRPLNDDLKASGLDKQILPARLTPWSRHGIVYGLPQDVHPVSLTYRKDLFDAAGVDPAQYKTWPQLQLAGERYVRYWQQHGAPDRRAILLSTSAADDLSIMLQQRHVNLLDEAGGVHLAEAIVAKTVMFYASLVAGDHAIAIEPSPGEGRWTGDIDRGDGAAVLTPDWRINLLKTAAPQLVGRIAMMPLPRFDLTDAPTASWGGTMIGFPIAGRHPEAAWALAMAITTHPPTGQLSAIPATWTNSIEQMPDSFFVGNQSIGELYIQLAHDLPARIVTPFSTLADVELSDVLRQAVQWQRGHPHDASDNPVAIATCMKWLQSAADDLRERIQLGTF